MGLIDWLRRPWLRKAEAPALPAPPAEVHVRTDHLPQGPGMPFADPLASLGGMRADSIGNHLSHLGTDLDKGTLARPRVARYPLTDAELISLHRDNGYAKKLVNMIPDDCVRRGWEITAGEEAAEGIADEEKRLSIRKRFRSAHRWGRLFGGAAILIVTEDDVPGDFAGRESYWLAEPLDPDRVKRVVNLVVLDKRQFAAAAMDEDITSPTFGQPRLWNVYPGAGRGSLVHTSRMIIFRGAELPPSVEYNQWGLGDSILQSVWDQVRNRTQVDQAGSIQAQQVTQDVITVKNLGAANAAEQAAAFMARLVAMIQGKSATNAILLEEGETWHQHETSLSGWNALDASTRASLQAVSGLGESQLFGTAPGGLNTDGMSGRKLYAALIAANQDEHYRTALEGLYTLLFRASEGAFDGAEPETWSLTFRPLDEPTPNEEAELRYKVAQTDLVYLQTGVLSPDHVGRSRFRTTGYSTETLPFEEMDEDALAAEIEAAMAAAAEGAQDEPRVDAVYDDPVKVVVWVTLEGQAAGIVESFADLAEDALHQWLRRPAEPHVTVLAMGMVERGDLPQVVDAVRKRVGEMEPPRPMRIRQPAVFPDHGAGHGVTLEVSSGGDLDLLHRQLFRDLAHLISKKQFPSYRAHVTLGYAEETPTSGEHAELHERVGAVLDGERAPKLGWGSVEVYITEPGEPDGRRVWDQLVGVPESDMHTDAETFQPPEAAVNAARRVLAWREEHGGEVEGMTEVGWRRARQLAKGDPVGIETVRAMSGFARHESNYQAARRKQRAEGGDPWTYAAIVAWLGWGGTTGVNWARRVSKANPGE